MIHLPLTCFLRLRTSTSMMLLCSWNPIHKMTHLCLPLRTRPITFLLPLSWRTTMAILLKMVFHLCSPPNLTRPARQTKKSAILAYATMRQSHGNQKFQTFLTQPDGERAPKPKRARLRVWATILVFLELAIRHMCVVEAQRAS